MNVKQLIKELEKIDNKFLEVEVYGFKQNHGAPYMQIKGIKSASIGKKVLIMADQYDV